MQTRHLTGPGELIAAIPTLVGFTPRESVVAVGLDGAGEVVAALRVDRNDARVAEMAASLGRAIAARLRAASARRAFLVTFTTDDVSLACPAVDALRPAVEAAVERVDVWACDGDRYLSPGCADPVCCPVGGRPVPWRTRGAVAPVSASALAHSLTEDEDDRATSSRRRSAARAADRWWGRRADGLDVWRCDSWQRCAESFPLNATAPEIGRAIAGLQDVRVRDALIVQWLGGSDDAIADTLFGRESPAVAGVLDGAMRDPGREPPDPAAVTASVRWCRRLLAHARRREHAPVLALVAVVLWWSGDMAGAQHSALAALRRDPDYSLARLVHDVTDARVAPAWTHAPGPGSRA
ncbi:DUF4192 family protein [Demequina muriae]|uniref:DUF4192 family protein n=1 Tax=Demequina muriae TaxID=3051664 RepID=A0ABT8GJG1_9MICO|nr:DUF4192 family protein [Demequina sp. EGI L300058]MDN4481573.1 DUF4192 family protein [Demequina sp. EGI L300058]